MSKHMENKISSSFFCCSVIDSLFIGQQMLKTTVPSRLCLGLTPCFWYTFDGFPYRHARWISKENRVLTFIGNHRKAIPRRPQTSLLPKLFTQTKGPDFWLSGKLFYCAAYRKVTLFNQFLFKMIKFSYSPSHWPMMNFYMSQWNPWRALFIVE